MIRASGDGCRPDHCYLSTCRMPNIFAQCRIRNDPGGVSPKRFALRYQARHAIGSLVCYCLAFLNVPLITCDAVEGIEIRQPAKS